MIPTLVLTLVAAAHGCAASPSPWPSDVLQVTTTAHLASVTMTLGDSGGHTFLIGNTGKGYRCVAMVPGGIPGPATYARLEADLQAQSIFATAAEVQSAVTAVGARWVYRHRFSVRFVNNSPIVISSQSARAQRSEILRRAPGSLVPAHPTAPPQRPQ